MAKMHVCYSNCTYDELLGYLLEDSTVYKKGDMVFALLDYGSVEQLDIDTVVIPEKCLLSADSQDLTQLIPVLRYGTIICNVIQELQIDTETTVELSCPYNIFCLLTKYLKPVCKTVRWINETGSFKNKDAMVILAEDKVIACKQKKTLCHDFSSTSLIETYGLDNICKVLDFSIKNSIYADVSYVPFKEVNPRHSKKTRFFGVVAY